MPRTPDRPKGRKIGRPKMDPDTCRVCGLKVHQTQFVKRGDSYENICKLCRAASRFIASRKKKETLGSTIWGGLYRANLTALTRGSMGVYPLQFRQSGVVAGYCHILEASIYVTFDYNKENHHLAIDFKGISNWLANKGIVVTMLDVKNPPKVPKDVLSDDIPRRDVRELVMLEDTPLQRELIHMEVEKLKERLKKLGD